MSDAVVSPTKSRLAALVLAGLVATPALASSRTAAQASDAHETSVATPASAEGRTLDGHEAIEAALAAHPGYRATAIEVRRAREHLRAETARFAPVLHLEGNLNVGNTPSLTLSGVAFPYNETVSLAAEVQQSLDTGMLLALRATGSRQFRRTVIIIPGTGTQTYPIGPGYGLDVTLTATQPFLRGFGDTVTRAEEHNAEVALEQAEATRDRRATELVRDTLQAYAELWYAEQAIAIDASARDLAVRQRDEAQARVEVGVSAPPDVLAFATRVASLEEALAVADADRRSRAILLATLLGLPLGTEVHAGSPPPRLPSRVAETEAVARAVADAPQLVELRTQVEAARRAAQVATEPLRARLDAQAQVGLHGLGYDDVPEAFAQVGTFAAFTATVGLVYEGPLDDTRRTAEEERARLAVDVAEQRLAEARATLEQQVSALVLQRAAAQRRLELAEQTVELARRTAEAEAGRVEVGTRTPTALLAAQEELRSAELRRTRALVDLYAAETSLLAYAGALLDDVTLP